MNRQKKLFNDNWHFHLGDIETPIPTQKGFAYVSSKTVRKHAGPAAIEYRSYPTDYHKEQLLSTESWKSVSLPHDYVIEGTPTPEGNEGRGFLPHENAWYRKEFTLSEEDRNYRTTLLFEGVATHATVYLNGTPIARNFCGYTEFEADLTDFLFFDRPNRLAVYVSTEEIEGWWYEGGGIYRNVWLIKTPLVSIEHNGLFACPKKQSETDWTLPLEATLRNDTDQDQRATVLFRACGQTLEEEILLPCRDTLTVRKEIAISSPHLWDVDDPYLYTFEAALLSAQGKDETHVRFGFRHVEVDAERGFFLNGRRVLIKGVCAHQDFGLTGKAVPDNILRHKVALMKEMGANGFRCSHYPHPIATMDALDDAGFLVMAETRWFDSSPEGIKELQTLIRRDRNHPSIVFWSIANEEPLLTTEQGVKIARSMIAAIRKLDNSRFITAAVDNPLDAEIFDDLDVIGCNYNYHTLDEAHQKYKNKPFVSSECCASGTSRGWYFADSNERALLNVADHFEESCSGVNWFRSREFTRKFMDERPWIMGFYQWTAFEHRGECVWPRLSSQSGAIDLYLNKKDAFYQNQSHFIEDRPILHILPHWNFKGMEGLPIKVIAYTNCEEVELFLNGKSVGRKAPEKFTHAEWEVPYEAGTLTAFGYNRGVLAIKDEQVTTEAPIALRLTAENKECRANGMDILLLTCDCIDRNGRHIPDAAPFVRFSTNGFGTVVGTGSSVTDHIPVICPDRQMYAGKISVAVKAGQKKGTLIVYASSDTLNSAFVKFELQ